jgi:hypothetical protein
MPDLNIPLSGIAALLVVCFLRLKTPGGSVTQKLRRIDWMYANSFQYLILRQLCCLRRGSLTLNLLPSLSISSGNGIVIASTVAVNLALTWGGVQHSWSSYHVLLPLIIGIAGLGLFLVYETHFPQEPIVPQRIWGNRTTGSGYVFIYSLVSLVGKSHSRNVLAYLA